MSNRPYPEDDNHNVFYIRFKGDKEYHKVIIRNPSSLEPIMAFLYGKFTYGRFCHLRDKLDTIKWLTGLSIPTEDSNENNVP